MAKEKETVSYTEVVNVVMEEGKYYNDAMDWYCMKYFSVVSEKTLFVLLSVFSVVIIFYLYNTINNILPLHDVFPVYKVQKDSLRYRTKVVPLKPKNIEYTSSEAILRMLLIYHSKEMFTHNYRSGNIEELNEKLSRIRLYSSSEFFEDYRKMFNAISGNLFNKDIEQKAYVTTFRLIKTRNKSGKNIITRLLREYFSSKIPTEAEITCVVDTIVSGSLRRRTSMKILFSFIYEPVTYNSIKNEFTKPRLTINNYTVLEENSDENV
jgi:type IV secretory pathway component VirB8